MAVRRLTECEHDLGNDAFGKPLPDCHAEPKGICEECGIGLCIQHIASHEKSCPKRKQDEQHTEPMVAVSGAGSAEISTEADPDEGRQFTFWRT